MIWLICVMSRFLRPGWLVLYVLIVLGVWWMMGSGWSLTFDSPVVIEEWDSLSSILSEQGRLSAYRAKRAASEYGFDPSQLKVWSYPVLSGDVSVEDFYAALRAGPSSLYSKATVLEWWSIYDTDAMLAKKWWIRPGEYVGHVTNASVIRNVRRTYDFLELLPAWGSSLEWFLYPDTYFIDTEKDVLDQLVTLQLNAFRDKIWLPHGNDLLMKKRRPSDMTVYELLSTASVVIKEESNTTYQPLVAGVFLNRLKKWMKLEADVTLCYGLKEPYETCTPSIIVKHLQDASNPYNTRAVKGIPPTPISSLTPSVVRAMIGVENHDYFYYLHGHDGVIRPGVTYDDHLYNKNKYLQ